LPSTGSAFDIRSLSFLENRKLAATYGDGTIRIWDSVKCLAELTYDSFASGSEDGEIRIWNMTGGTNVKTWRAHSQPIKSLVLLPKQKYLASLSIGKEIKIWDFHQGSFIRALISKMETL